MFSNFIYRVGQWLRDNRARVIRVLLILAAILIAVFLIFAGVGYLKDQQYAKRIQTLETDIERANERANEAEGRAALMEYEIEMRKAELEKLQAIADAADAALLKAQGKTKILREQYETIRYVPIPADTPVSVESACAELAGLGYRCQ